MEIIKFKTNVTNEAEVARVAPILDQVENISRWKIDPASADHILSVSGSGLDPREIESRLQASGFQAHTLRVVGISGEDL